MVSWLKRVVWLMVLLFLTILFSDAQNIIFTDHNNLGVFYNPGNISSDNKPSLNIMSRKLTLLGDIDYNSYAGMLVYPITGYKSARRYGGIAISAFTDRYDYAGGLESTGFAFSSSIKVRLQYLSWLNLGFQGMIYQKGYNSKRFTTGSQWDPNKGFDSELTKGEPALSEKVENFTFSSGLYWHKNNVDDLILSYFGMAIYNINKPEEEYISNNVKVPMFYTVEGGYRVFLNKNTTILPSFIYMSQKEKELLNFSVTYSFFFNNECKCFNSSSGSFDVVGRYLTSKRISLGGSYVQDNYMVSVNYETGFDSDDVSTVSNAIEIGIRFMLKGKKAPLPRPKVSGDNEIPEFSDTLKHDEFREFESLEKFQKQPDYSEEKIKDKQRLIDSLRNVLAQQNRDAGERARLIDSLKNTLAKKKVDFKLSVDLKFSVNDTTLSEYARLYLADLCKILIYNKEFHVNILGHADQTGTKEYNDMLSQKRADVVRRFIIQNGINAVRLHSIGKGYDDPRYNIQSDEERAKNRRVEFVIFNIMNR